MTCRQLGYSGAINATTHSFFGPVETPLQKAMQYKIPYTADEVSCKGTEVLLSECPFYEKSNCGFGEAAGVICQLEPDENMKKLRRKRAVDPQAVAAVAETGSKIIGSAVEYFDRKEKEKQAYLKERPDQVDLSSSGVEIKLKNEKGYMDLGGEFESGGMNLKIQDIPAKAPQKESGGQSFSYPAGIGPMLMNGCFGSGYKEGDPCFAAKRFNTRCYNQIESANFVGVGFDATGDYNHGGRRKSLIQRTCAGKVTYQGEDLPDNMNVFGIYDSACTGKSFQSMEGRSQFQREQAKMGENKDFLRYSDGSNTQVSVKGEA